ncbi:MAG: tripartite tricarboxylate transporter substrate binding protein [Burkholderiales bacterium]|nr:tripartite tricarboxylate transporter substrate binding protein [Burkholderiales bacterium]
MNVRWIGLIVLALAAGGAQGQAYPSKLVRLVVGYPAGGSIDVVGRMLGNAFTRTWGQQFIVENRSGAAGTIAARLVADAAPDGHTLLVGAAAQISSAPSNFRKLSYDPQRDLTAIALVAKQPNILIVHPSVPVRSAKEFIARVKANPGKFTYGSSGIGATQHMSAELFAMMTGAQIVHVPYKGGAPAMIDLLSGQIDFMFSVVPTAVPYIKAGRVRGIALTSLNRIEALPDVPTLHESGLAGFDFSGWIGLLGPANVPPELVAQLNAEVNKAVKGALRKPLVDLGLGLAPGTPEQFAAFIREDTAKIARIVKAAKIPPQ